MTSPEGETLVVCSYFPYPLDSGDPVRVSQIISALSTVHRVTLLAVRRRNTTSKDLKDFRVLHPTVRLELYNLSAPSRLRALILSLFARRPLWVSSRFSPGLQRRVREGSALGQRFFVVGEGPAAYFDDTQTIWHWDKANVLSFSSRLEALEVTGPLNQLKARVNSILSRQYESSMIQRPVSISVTSPEDAHRLEDLLNRRADLTIKSVVALPEAVTTVSGEDTGAIAWVGSFDYEPNVSGLRRFLQEGWSHLAQAGYTLKIIGSGDMDRAAKGLQKLPGVRWVGYSEELGGELSTCAIGIVPLWSGAGVKLKTLTLMSFGLAVYGTTQAYEGIAPPYDWLMADTPRGLARAIIKTQAEEKLRAREACRKVIADSFSEATFRDEVLNAVELLHKQK